MTLENDRLGRHHEDSLHDPVTGLVDIGALQALTEYALARARRDGEFLSLVCLEIESLHDVIEQYGSDAGDVLVVEFSQLVRRDLRASDVVARVGVDEFALLLSQTNAAQTAIVIHHIAVILRERNRKATDAHALSARVGCSTFDPLVPDRDFRVLFDEARTEVASQKAVLA